MIATLNLAARFALELAGVAALAYAGFHTTTGPLRWLAAIAAPAAMIAVWALIVAPRAVNPVPVSLREVVGTIILLGCAAALVATGQPGLGITLGVLAVLNNVLLFALGTPMAGVAR
jgi:hypothetical protein